MKKSTAYILIISGVLLFFLFLGWIIAGPSRPIQLSKQTTYLVEPLRPNGLVDYEQALLEMQSAGVTPDANAAIPFLQAMWPCELTAEQQILVCDALGMELPDRPGMISSTNVTTLGPIMEWLNEQQTAKRGDGSFTPLTTSEAMHAVEEAYHKPWTRAQLPPLADWMDRQAENFAKLHAMNDRPQFFLPAVAWLNDEYDPLLGSMLPTIQPQREAARCLGARAMFNIGESQPGAAWEDIKTTFTLSRCHPRPGCIIDILICTAFRGMACSELSELLNSGQCDATLLGEIEQFLNQLQPLHEMPEVMDISERFSTLDAATNFSAGNLESSWIIGEENEVFGSLSKIPYDRNAMLQKINELYDQLVAAMKIEDLDDRQAALDQFDADVQAEIAAIKTGGNVAAAIFNQTARGEMIGRMMIAFLLSASSQAAIAEERVNVQVQLLRVAVALQQYKVETGDYPDTLDALNDRIDPALLNDPYSNGQLRYDRRPPGYLLYSLYLDRTDDRGSSSYGETIDGEWVSEATRILIYPQGDWVIRFPLPHKTFLDPPPWEVLEEEEDLDIEMEEPLPMETANPPVE